MHLRKYFLILILSLTGASMLGQEILCTVQVTSPRIEGTDRRVFESMQTAIFEFINNRTWTNYTFETEERIECSILITIDERVSVDEFKGKINLILRRPVYNSAYDTPLFNYVDNDFRFEYIEFQPLDYAENTYTSNLTSVLAFYVNIFLGLDFDSFSLYGGTPFFESAQNIVNTAQSSAFAGWKAYENTRNRYWLVENLLNPAYQSLRKFSYEYHRNGLDIMSEKAAEGRGQITRNLDLLRTTYNERPGLFLLQLLVEAKRDEFINLYSEGSNTEKTNAINILSEIDPANSSKYQAILQR